MGCFSCFDSSDDETLNPAAEESSKTQKQSQPTVSNTLSALPSGPFDSNHYSLMVTRSQDLILCFNFTLF